MANYAITHIVGQTALSRDFRFQSREGLTVALTLLSAVGVPHNGTGGRIAFVFQRPNSTSSLRHSVAGAANGLYPAFGIPTSISRALDGTYVFSIWWEPPSNGTPVLLVRGDTIVDLAASGGDSLDPIPSEEATLPLQQTIEVAGILDQPGNTQPLPAVPACRAYYAGPIVLEVTLTQLQGPGADPTATGTLYVGQNGASIGAPIPMIQVQGSPGKFRGVVGAVHQHLVASTSTITLQAWVRPTGGEEYATHQPVSITLVPSGKPVNQPPVVTITSPTEGASVLPGSNVVSFGCVDPDGTLTAANFSALVDNVAVVAEATLTSGSGTGTVIGTIPVNLPALGAHSVSVRCEDVLQGIGTGTHNVQVVQPVLTITSPIGGAVIDDGQVLVTASTVPAMPGGTVLSVYERVGQVSTLLGTGTLAAGVTTAALAVGAHTLYATVTTVVGVVSSADVTITAQAQTPQITITAPTAGQSIQLGTTTVTAEVTHTSGAGAITQVRARFAAGVWATLTRVGETNVYTSAIVNTGTVEGDIVVTVEATDRTPTVATATVTPNVTRDQIWSNTVSFAVAADSAQTAAAGAVVLNFDVANAVNGRTWRIRLPAGAASVQADIVSGAASVFAAVAATAQPPTGWQVVWDQSVATSWGQTAQGFVPWTPGVAYTLLARVNTATQRIHLSAQITQELTLAAWTHRWTFDGTLACVHPVTGVAIPAADAVHIVTSGAAPTFAADPGDTAVASRGQALRTTSDQHCTHLPVSRGAGDWSIACWVSATDDPGNLSYGPLAPNLSDGGCDNLWRNPTDGAGVHCLVVGETRVAARVTELWGDTMLGRWYHLAYAYRASDNHFLVWVNGRLVLDQVWDRAPINGDVTSGWVVGGQNTRADNGARGANCYIREAAVTPSLVSTAQVQAHLRLTAPPAVALPDVVTVETGSSIQDSMNVEMDSRLGDNWTVRGGNVGGSRCSDAWVAGINTFATQIPVYVQLLARGARTLVHCDQGLAVNADFAAAPAAVRARYWGDIERIARCGGAPVTALMTGHTDAPSAFAVREDTLENATDGWRAHLFSVMFTDEISAIGLDVVANYVEPIGVTLEAGPHRTALGRGLVADRKRDTLVLATGVAA